MKFVLDKLAGMWLIGLSEGRNPKSFKTGVHPTNISKKKLQLLPIINTETF